MIHIPIEFIKGTLGYREVKPNKETATHMLYTTIEHDDKSEKIINLEEYVIKLQDAFEKEVTKILVEANSNIQNTKENAENKIKEMKIELHKALNQIKHLENINKNLLRVAKEKANAQRKLQPKKQHCGYVLQLVEPVIFTHKDTHKRRVEITSFDCWRFRLQTPYNVFFDLEAVTDLVHKDYYNRLADIIGVHEGYANGGLENSKAEEVIKIFKEKDNFYFKKSFKINATRGFWEVEYWTRDIINYSAEILINGNNVRVNEDGEKNSN